MRGRLAIALALAAAPAAVPAAAGAAEPIMPLSDVHAGMTCTGYTVVRGTTISSFTVSVIDVVTGDPTLPGPRILVRVSGPAVEPWGIAAGFSGSPVVCPDAGGTARVAGAIAATVGDYGNKVGLATPIEEILGERPDPPRGARSRPALLRRARPVAAPLTVSGVSGATLRALRTAAAHLGRPLVATPAGPLGSFPRQDLRPGASVAAAIASGDIDVGSIGTVTYRDGANLWAFGHELDAAGRRALLLEDAYVFTVINQPQGSDELSSFKLAAPGHDLGTFTNDAFGAVVGRVGSLPRTIPLSVSVRDLDTGRTFFSSTRVADESTLDLGTGLGLVGSLALGQGQNTLLRSSPPRQTSSICLRIRIAQRRGPLGFCGDYFDGTGALDDYGSATDLLDAYDRSPLDITSIGAHLRVRRGVREVFLRSGSVAPGRARAGHRVRVRLVARGRRDGTRRFSFRLRLPRSLAPGVHILTLRGQPEPRDDSSETILLEGVLGGSGGSDSSGPPSPRSIGELAARIAALRKVRGLRGGFGSSRRLLLRSDTVLFRGSVRIRVRVRR